jgi:hypothetical protein
MFMVVGHEYLIAPSGRAIAAYGWLGRLPSRNIRMGGKLASFEVALQGGGEIRGALGVGGAVFCGRSCRWGGCHFLVPYFGESSINDRLQASGLCGIRAPSVHHVPL